MLTENIPPKNTADNDANAIEVCDLKKAFGPQKVLDGLNLRAEKGETIAVLGKSGTGKSVLLKLLIGLQKPDAGTIQIAGQRIEALGSDALNAVRKKIGFLFQNAALYDSLTVERNVEFPLSRHTHLSAQERRDKARELLASVGMDKHFEKMPSEISGGMQKRVGLARALTLDPEIILFDEPTAGLDPITSEEIGKLILDLKEKRHITAVVVTHDLRTTKQFADRLVLIDKGKVLAEGTFADLQKNKNPFVMQFFGETE